MPLFAGQPYILYGHEIGLTQLKNIGMVHMQWDSTAGTAGFTANRSALLDPPPAKIDQKNVLVCFS